jgi:hypothetical protein
MKRFVARSSRQQRAAGTVHPFVPPLSIKDRTMFIAILQNTPVWVWGLLAALIALGLSQAFARSIPLRRAIAMPLVMVGLSLFGVTSVFGGQPLALLVWAAGLAITATLMLKLGAARGVSWSATEQLLKVPGSWWPLVTILGIFITKFAVGVTLAMHPSFAQDAAFATSISLIYGSFSGVFFGRGAAMWRVAHRAVNGAA